jgi:hypothetical protein
MSSFSYGEFMTVTGEIERYLGYLKGNETVAQYFNDQVAYVETNAGSWGLEATWSGNVPYRTTPADGDLSVDFTMWNWVSYIHEPYDARRGPWADQLVEGAGESWDNGNAWADGIGDYIRDLCADITRPDADLLQSAVQEFSDTRIALEGAMPVDWTDLDFTSWIGESSDQCQDVITEFHSVVRDQYLTYFAHAETLFAGAGALVSQAQAGLNPMLTDIRDGLRQQLEAWAAYGNEPSDFAGINPLVPKIFDIGSQIVDLIPVVGDIKGKVEDVGGVVGDILGLFGAEPQFNSREPFEAQSAEEVYNKMMGLLQDDYLRPYGQAMQRIRSERSTAIHAAQNSTSPWFMDTLGGISSEPWQHEAEAS